MLQFGDVIYRPCISYAGRKYFVNTQIVKEVLHRDNGDYILSIDVFAQEWTDKITDLGSTISTDRTVAYDLLWKKIISDR